MSRLDDAEHIRTSDDDNEVEIYLNSIIRNMIEILTSVSIIYERFENVSVSGEIAVRK